MTVQIRKANDRGAADHGWLKSHHTFSFGDYFDPAQRGFRVLRVINDDWIAPRGGFPEHPHRDMEIVTYLVSGALQHRDSLGTSSVIRPGEVQRMTAGTGVVHSEFNHSSADPLRLLQIWIQPDRNNLEPGYEQRHFSAEEKRDRLRLVVSPDGRDGSISIHQDACVYASVLGAGVRVEHALASGRHAWVQIVSGRARLGDLALEAGDGVKISAEDRIELAAAEETELLLFDLP